MKHPYVRVVNRFNPADDLSPGEIARIASARQDHAGAGAIIKDRLLLSVFLFGYYPFRLAFLPDQGGEGAISASLIHDLAVYPLLLSLIVKLNCSHYEYGVPVRERR
jgi:hypothetical protein